MSIVEKIKSYIKSWQKKNRQIKKASNMIVLKSDWLLYLDSISLATQNYSQSPKSFWLMLEQNEPMLKSPLAWLDEESFHMSFDNNEHHLDIELFANSNTFEWFYRNRITNECDGDDSKSIEMSKYLALFRK